MKREYLLACFLFLIHSVTGQTLKKEQSQPFVLGEIHVLHSNLLNEKRTLNIYLPEGYHSTDTVRYPVIYLLDGSADEDFIHVVGLVQFNSFEWVNIVPKSIVVGIANVDRRRDMTFPTTIEADRKHYPTTGHADKFIGFIKDELQPYINKTFRTTNSRTLIGESLGGLFATQILFEYPSMFDQYIIVSPSIWWDNGSILKKQPQIANSNGIKTNVYIGVEKGGLTPTDSPRVMEVDANLLADKLRGLKVYNVLFDYLPEETHATIMHQALLNAFRQLHSLNTTSRSKDPG